MFLVNFNEILPTNLCKLIEYVECLDAKKQQASNTRGVNGKLGDACLIPVDEPARQVTAPPGEEIKSPTQAAKKKYKQASKKGLKVENQIWSTWVAWQRWWTQRRV